MKHQQLNGVSDWWDAGADYFSEAVEYASGVASDAWDVQTSMVEGAYDWVAEKAGELTSESMAILKDFQKKMDQLVAVQKKVDEAINSLPENSITRQRLSAKRQESRSIFQEYVLPAWESFSDWAGFEAASDFGGAGQGMGLVVSGSIVAGAAAVLTLVPVAIVWINKSNALEMAILADPDLKKEFVTQRGSSLATVSRMGKYAVWGIGGVVLIYALKLAKEFAD